MRRFTFHADLRGARQPSAPPSPEAAAPERRDGLSLSERLGGQRRHMRRWPDFQRALRALPPAVIHPEDFDDPELALEYQRIYQVTRERILEAVPGFAEEGRTATHCFFDPEGAKHLVSRLLARPHQRLTEVVLAADGSLIRKYYENVGGPEQSLEDLYEQGLTGLEDQVVRFARYPHYQLKVLFLPCEYGVLLDIQSGLFRYDEELADVVVVDSESSTPE